jgi:hypothetical protein
MGRRPDGHVIPIHQWGVVFCGHVTLAVPANYEAISETKEVGGGGGDELCGFNS